MGVKTVRDELLFMLVGGMKIKHVESLSDYIDDDTRSFPPFYCYFGDPLFDHVAVEKKNAFHLVIAPGCKSAYSKRHLRFFPFQWNA